jgi:Ca2+-transporting ATPase
MYVPGLNGLLGISPITLNDWLFLMAIASSLLVVSEIEKVIYRRQLAARP